MLLLRVCVHMYPETYADTHTQSDTHTDMWEHAHTLTHAFMGSQHLHLRKFIPHAHMHSHTRVYDSHAHSHNAHSHTYTHVLLSLPVEELPPLMSDSALNGLVTVMAVISSLQFFISSFLMSSSLG